MLLFDLFSKMLSALNSCYLWKVEVESGSTSESLNLFWHAGTHYQEPTEWPYLLVPWKKISPMYKELLRRNNFFASGGEIIHAFLLLAINQLSLNAHGMIHLKDYET